MSLRPEALYHHCNCDRYGARCQAVLMGTEQCDNCINPEFYESSLRMAKERRGRCVDNSIELLQQLTGMVA